MFFKKSIAVICLLLMAGCRYPFEFKSEGEIREEVLADDPSFSSILKQKAELDENIAGLKSDLSSKENAVNAKILALKRDFASEKDKILNRIKELDRQFDPYRLEMKQKIMELSAELKLKESSLSATNRMVSKLKKLVEQNSGSEDMKADISKWQVKIEAQSRTAEALRQEIADLRKKIRIVRLKLKLIR